MTEETPTQTTDIEAHYKSLPFTKNAGYTHYAPKDEAEKLARDSYVAEFLENDELDEPNSDPTRYTESEIERTAAEYDAALAELMSKPNRTEDDEILIDKIIDKTGELFRYEELMLAVGSVATGRIDSHRRIASELSLEIMGGVNDEAFGGLVNELLDDAAGSDSQYARELENLVGRQPVSESAFEAKVELQEKTRETIGADLLTLYPGLGELLRVDSGEKLPVAATDALALFESLQQNAGLEGWQTKLDDGSSAHTSGAEKTVYIGKDRVFKNYREAIGVGFHEAIVHGNRSEGISYPGFLDFEEGLATRLQQIITGEKRTPGVQFYLSIGLQAGSDRNGEPRSYRETFEIMWRREALLMEKAGKEVDEQKARAAAQKQVQRTRRGGAVDGRDASYFVGAQKAAEWLNEMAGLPPAERRRKLALVLTNRIDPTVPEQMKRAEIHG